MTGQYDDTACYFNGEIRVGDEFWCFSFKDLMHEYGHYLQKENSDFIDYASGAIGSAWDMLTKKGEGLAGRSFEKEASEMGEKYAKLYLK